MGSVTQVLLTCVCVCKLASERLQTALPQAPVPLPLLGFCLANS